MKTTNPLHEARFRETYGDLVPWIRADQAHVRFPREDTPLVVKVLGMHGIKKPIRALRCDAQAEGRARAYRPAGKGSDGPKGIAANTRIEIRGPASTLGR